MAANIGHWRDNTGGQDPAAGGTWEALDTPTEIRNDGAYSRPSDSELEFDEDGSYLLIGKMAWDSVSSALQVAAIRFSLVTGTAANFVSTTGADLMRDTSGDHEKGWVYCVALMYDASAGDKVELEFYEQRALSMSTIAGEVELIAIKIAPEAVAIAKQPTPHTATYGGTTPVHVDFATKQLETDSSKIEIDQTTDTGRTDFICKTSGARYLVFGCFGFGDMSTISRTQRVARITDGANTLCQGQIYLRSSPLDRSSCTMMALAERNGSNISLSMEAWRGDGVAADEGGADADSDWDVTLTNPSMLCVVELPSAALVSFTKMDTSTADATSTTPVDVAIDEADILRDSSKFGTPASSAVPVIGDGDVLAFFSAFTARSDPAATDRLTSFSNLTVNGSEQVIGEGGMYTRGEDGANGTFGGHLWAIGYLELSDGDDVGASITRYSSTDDGGGDRAQPGLTFLMLLDADSIATAASPAVSFDPGTLNETDTSDALSFSAIARSTFDPGTLVETDTIDALGFGLEYLLVIVPEADVAGELVPYQHTHHIVRRDMPARACELLLADQRRRPRLKAFAEALGAAAQITEDLYYNTLVGTTLDGAEGMHLDRWGKVVGELRGGLTETQYREFISWRAEVNSIQPSTPTFLDLLRRLLDGYTIEGFPMYPQGAQFNVSGGPWVGDARGAHIAALLRDAKPPVCSAPVTLVLENGWSWGDTFGTSKVFNYLLFDGR